MKSVDIFLRNLRNLWFLPAKDEQLRILYLTTLWGEHRRVGGQAFLLPFSSPTDDAGLLLFGYTQGDDEGSHFGLLNPQRKTEV